MQNLIELYEMASINDGALCRSERMAILQARFALSMFERAMQHFKAASAEVLSPGEIPFDGILKTWPKAVAA